MAVLYCRLEIMEQMAVLQETTYEQLRLRVSVCSGPYTHTHTHSGGEKFLEYKQLLLPENVKQKTDS